MHTRDYSDETSRVIDEEVEAILREQEIRAVQTLEEHRAGLDKVAAALLEFETIDGGEVARLVDEAFGGPAGGGGKSVPSFGHDEERHGMVAPDPEEGLGDDSSPDEPAGSTDDTVELRKN